MRTWVGEYGRSNFDLQSSCMIFEDEGFSYTLRNAFGMIELLRHSESCKDFGRLYLRLFPFAI